MNIFHEIQEQGYYNIPHCASTELGIKLLGYWIMKNVKSLPKLKIERDFSLPKLEAKIKNNKKLHDHPRLNFPSKDDTSYVRDVGRKHFMSNNSLSLQKLINPEFKQPSSPEFNDLNFRSVEIANLSKKLMQNKLSSGSYHAITQVSDPPFARNYQTENKTSSKNQENTNKIVLDRQKIKTQLNGPQIGYQRAGVGLMEKSIIAAELINKKIDINFRASSKRKEQTQNDNYPPRKMHSVPQDLLTDKNELRKYNPTFISSNF